MLHQPWKVIRCVSSIPTRSPLNEPEKYHEQLCSFESPKQRRINFERPLWFKLICPKAETVLRKFCKKEDGVEWEKITVSKKRTNMDTSWVSLNKFQLSICFNASRAFLRWLSSLSSPSNSWSSLFKSSILWSSSDMTKWAPHKITTLWKINSRANWNYLISLRTEWIFFNKRDIKPSDHLFNSLQKQVWRKFTKKIILPSYIICVASHIYFGGKTSACEKLSRWINRSKTIAENSTDVPKPKNLDINKRKFYRRSNRFLRTRLYLHKGQA